MPIRNKSWGIRSANWVCDRKNGVRTASTSTRFFVWSRTKVLCIVSLGVLNKKRVFIHKSNPRAETRDASSSLTDMQEYILEALSWNMHSYILYMTFKFTQLKSWLYTVYIWIFRRAVFPLKQYGLWVPILVSEIICVLAQNALIFFISPFVSDAGIG